MALTGRLKEMKSGLKVIDQYGEYWDIVADDMNGHYAIQKGDEAAEFARQVDAEGDIYPRYNGHTFGVNCSDELVVRGGNWYENDDLDCPECGCPKDGSSGVGHCDHPSHREP